jgi:hypothetical protein
MLTFVVPIRHPANATNWSESMRRLQQTLRSVAAQRHPAWRAVVVANDGADLPPLPDGVGVVRVGFAPNPRHDRRSADQETVYDAFRLDKGRRVLAGMLRAPGATHFMILDDDDLVSERLAGFVAAHADANGWFLQEGYVWEDGGRVVYRHPRFSRLCGSSHIVRADLYRLPSRMEEADEGWIKRTLGSHRFIHEDLERAGTPLAPLPFPGAVYRIGHSGAHSQSGGLLRTFLLTRDLLASPRALLATAARLRPLTRTLRDEFFH